MTTYIVNIFREMRLSYADIEADTPVAAAMIVSRKLTDGADNIEDCDGQNLSALVDVAGDEDFEHSVLIDFEAERIRKAAARLLAALEKCAALLADYDDDPGEEGENYRDAIAAIAEAKTAGICPAPGDIEIHALLAGRRQIAVIWCIEDVQEVRPDLTDGQSWEVLQAADRYHDATIGINWDVLRCHADMLFGAAPAANDAGEEQP